jgi:hypothetical protein
LSDSRKKVRAKDFTIKELRRKFAVQKSLYSIIKKKLEKAKSNKHIPGILRRGIREFLLSKKLTKAQVQVLINPNQKFARCSRDDIINNLYLRSVSPRAYEYLRKNGPLYLPSRQTMERWLDGMMKCDNEFNEDAIKVQRMKLEASENPLYKYAQVIFDEVHVKETVELDKKNQQVIGPHKKLQTVMIRGLACD